MPQQKTLARGAEAILTKSGSTVLKNRIEKGYRHPILDKKLRKRRTRSEAKLIEKASKLIPTPKIINYNNKKSSSTTNQQKTKLSHNSGKGGWVMPQEYQITLEYISGKSLSDSLEKLNPQKICRQIGKNIALLHDSGIIHGDLTTSNMIYVPDKKLTTKKTNQNSNSDINNKKSRSQRLRTTINKHEPSRSEAGGKVFFIDFGLGFHSDRIEDKAVDLHLIKQALEAKHPSIYEKAFKSVLEGYKANSKHAKQTLIRLKKVESRGRYKKQY